MAIALKWAIFAIKSSDYEWAEREIKQAIAMLEEGQEKSPYKESVHAT